MPQLNTPNSLYKFITNKLCHPMRICVESRVLWAVNKYYGMLRSNHTYYITLWDTDMQIRYEYDYWNQEIIDKYGKDP